jgi:metal-sulfur cluster biosynthetic enzyme
VTDRAHVLDALGTVFDPELDEPITSLRFVTSCDVTAGGDVDVRLRLPTPQCAPNFAFLMAADARDAVRRPAGGWAEVSVVLEDHYTGCRDQRRGGPRRGVSPEAFPGETEGELDALRELFHRKALVARQSRLCEELGGRRSDPRGGDSAPGGRPPTRSRRASLPRAARAPGHPGRRRGPAFVRPDGAPITAAELTHWLRMARLVRTSLEANGGICRSLLAVRYDIHDPEEVAAA